VPRRRIAELPPALELAREEGVDVVASRKRDSARLGLERLHEDTAGRIPSAPACELRHELEGALLGAEVGHAEARVRVDHCRERDIGEVVPLGHHLRPDQDRSIRRRECAKRRGELTWLPDRVGVEPEPLQLGKPLLELSLEALRTGSDPRHVDRAALGARLGGGLGEAAVVAVELVVAVEDERHVAVRAAPRLAAGTTMDRRCDAAAVEQQDRLAASLGQLA
jgi:hypothetical protein